MDNQHKYTIVGAGGFAKEVYNCLLQRLNYDNVDAFEIDFVVDDNYLDVKEIYGMTVHPLSTYDFKNRLLLIAIAEPHVRKKFADKLSNNQYATLIHPTAQIGMNVQLGTGSIVAQNVVLTCDITVGKHAQFNLNTTVGHDCRIGDFFTSAPSANISGNCKIGNEVYLGTQAAVKEKVHISNNVTVGMGGIVINDLKESGTYMGIPAKLKSV